MKQATLNPEAGSWENRFGNLWKSPVAALCERRGKRIGKETTAVTDRRYNQKPTFAEISFEVRL
jgi:hypothetical protein